MEGLWGLWAEQFQCFPLNLYLTCLPPRRLRIVFVPRRQFLFMVIILMCLSLTNEQ